MGEDWGVLRTRMVNNQLRTFDVTDYRVQDAMLAVERHRFVPQEHRGIAYSDEALPIAYDGAGQASRTMTRPAVLGRLLQLARLRDHEVVLLVGAGVGYTAAVVGLLAGSVIALEDDVGLAERASETLEAADVANVVVVTGPLEAGYPSEAPFDVVFVDGAVEVAPNALIEQLKVGGRLIAIEGRGLAGRAKQYNRAEAGISSRYAFNAAAGVLPGFEAAESFVF